MSIICSYHYRLYMTEPREVSSMPLQSRWPPINRLQLYVDNTQESKKAVLLLEENNKSFLQLVKGRDFLECDFNLPALFASFGVFHGLEEIELFVNSKLT